MARVNGTSLFAAIFAGVITSSLLFFFFIAPVYPEAAEPNPAWEEASLQILMSTRVCGSPAVDGYAHVNPECLEASPTNIWWQRAKPSKDDLVVHLEERADYDGLAVAWGVGNKKKSLQECAQACKEHVPSGSGPFGKLPCNTFVWCGTSGEIPSICWEPDVHKHTGGDCWLKFTEAPASPEVNMRGNVSQETRTRHSGAPELVPWSAGVLLPRGVTLTNGTWSPRYHW